MAGRGPAPKPREKRAGHTKDPHPLKVVELVPLDSTPTLPDSFMVATRDGTKVLEFPAATQDWFQNWVDSPFSKDFDALAWERVRMAAILHARSEYGDLNSFKEFRLHMALFPETPADRLRLRYQVAQAVDAEVTVAGKIQRSPYAALRATDALEA